MNYNDLMKKYRAGQPEPQPAPEPVPEPQPAPEPRPQPGPEKPKAKAPRAKTPPVSTATPKAPAPEAKRDRVPPAAARKTPPARQPRRSMGAMSPQMLRSLPWLDIVLLLLTLVGLICVIVNFDAITLALAYGISQIIRFLCGLLLVAAIIVGLVLIFRSRRRW